MLRIDPVELANRFQRPGGVDWVAFMDALLWAACWQVGIPESAVRTNPQNSDRDVTGYLKCRSIWQYKSAHESKLSPTELVGGGLKAMAKGEHNYAFLLMGAPGVLGSFTKHHASLQMHGMWDGKGAPFTEGEWDYFDFDGALPPGSPGNTFGGMSGGGLWRVQFYPHPKREKISSTIALEGVAFYELGTTEGKGIIRCHGMKSIQKVLERLVSAEGFHTEQI